MFSIFISKIDDIEYILLHTRNAWQHKIKGEIHYEKINVDIIMHVYTADSVLG